MPPAAVTLTGSGLAESFGVGVFVGLGGIGVFVGIGVGVAGFGVGVAGLGVGVGAPLCLIYIFHPDEYCPASSKTFTVPDLSAPVFFEKDKYTVLLLLTQAVTQLGLELTFKVPFTPDMETDVVPPSAPIVITLCGPPIPPIPCFSLCCE